MTIHVIDAEPIVFTALRAFITHILPSNVPIVRGQVNRVPEPLEDFVVMTPLRRERLETNIDDFYDTRFTASILDNVLTVQNVNYGMLTAGNTVWGTGVADNTTITGTLGGTGTNTWLVSPSQTVSNGVMAAGIFNAVQPTKFVIQVDIHGKNSGNNTQIISTLFRDWYATEFFVNAGYFGITPLYADDGKQIPFINSENQYEFRWVLEVCLEADQAVIQVPQQFAEELHVTTIEADVK